MNHHKHDEIWRQFQEELGALDNKPDKPLSKEDILKLTREQQLALARTEFHDIQRKYGLNIGDVLSYFPEDESVPYLQSLMG